MTHMATVMSASAPPARHANHISARVGTEPINTAPSGGSEAASLSAAARSQPKPVADPIKASPKLRRIGERSAIVRAFRFQADGRGAAIGPAGFRATGRADEIAPRFGIEAPIFPPPAMPHPLTCLVGQEQPQKDNDGENRDDHAMSLNT